MLQKCYQDDVFKFHKSEESLNFVSFIGNALNERTNQTRVRYRIHPTVKTSRILSGKIWNITLRPKQAVFADGKTA